MSLSNIKTRITYAITMAGIYMSSPAVYAAPAEGTDGGAGGTGATGTAWADYVKDFVIPETQSVTSVLGKVLGALISVSEMFGAVILIWGIVRFYLSFKNEDPEAKQRALMTICTGCLLFTLQSVLHSLKLIL